MSRVIAVTGSASGIGKAVSDLLTAAGDRVVGVDLRDADVEADLSTREGRDRAVEGIRAAAGDHLDAVVACAGLSGPVAACISVNYFGVTELLTGLQPLLAAAEAPRAAVVSSISSTQGSHPKLLEACLAGDETLAMELADAAVAKGRGLSMYPTSKAALSQWVRRTSVSPGWADAGIPLNAAAPGVVLTPMSEPLFADPGMRELMDVAVPMPLGGYAPPEAVAHLLVWLVSPQNTHVTGQIIFVDGGADASVRPNDHY